MPSSKLEKYVSVLEALVLRPHKLDSIAYKVKLEVNSVKRSLDFLISNELVEKRTLSGKHEVYAITERGLSVFKTLRTLRYLEKLKKTLPVVEEAREVTSVLAEHPRKEREHY